jgi:formylglycine-generating enzyme required for sulfatase activity
MNYFSLKSRLKCNRQRLHFFTAGAFILAVTCPQRVFAGEVAERQKPALHDTTISSVDRAIKRESKTGARSNSDSEKSAVKDLKESKGMILLPAGTFWMGCDEASFNDARPVHKVHVNQFWIDKTEVTNEQFAKFVEATGYKTIAEIKPSAKDFPDAPPENLVAGAVVFTPPVHTVSKHSHYNWWHYVPGANWRHPEGPQSNIKQRMHHPVVHIAWPDAVAYAKWAGKRLPSEAEFEYATRGGLDRKQFSWGNDFKPKGKWQANLWQGLFPYKNTGEDGFVTTSPVATFPANGYGLYDLTGNVWEWCSDWYRPDYYQTCVDKKIENNPPGPEDSADPNEPSVPKRVQRGGSFLCTDQYCARYLAGARGKGEPSSGSSNVGFRCVKDSSP